MSEKCSTYDANQVDISHELLPTEKNQTGNVTTGSVDLGECKTLTTGVWEHSKGISTDIESDEVFVILSGKGRIFVDDSVLELYPGVVGVLHAGSCTRWEIDEPIRKVYVFPR